MVSLLPLSTDQSSYKLAQIPEEGDKDPASNGRIVKNIQTSFKTTTLRIVSNPVLATIQHKAVTNTTCPTASLPRKGKQFLQKEDI